MLPTDVMKPRDSFLLSPCPDVVLQQKIVKLLSPPQQYNHPSYDKERWLVALILITRLECDDEATAPCDSSLLLPETLGKRKEKAQSRSPLSRFLEENSTKLETFCLSLLSSDPCRNGDGLLYTRLVAQFLTTCGRNKFPIAYDALLRALVMRPPPPSPGTDTQLPGAPPQQQLLSALDLEIVSALDVCLPLCQSLPSQVDEILLQICRRRDELLLRMHRAPSNPPTSNSTNPEPSPPSSNPSLLTENPTSPSDVLEATLSQILDQSSPWIGSGTKEDLQVAPSSSFQWWEWHASALVVQHFPRTVVVNGVKGSPPNLPPPATLLHLLEGWLSRRGRQRGSREDSAESLSLSTSWTLVLLQGLQDCRSALPLAHDPTLASQVLKALMACVVTTRPDDQLRASAWAAVLALVGCHGWEWTLVESPDSLLGCASHLCAFLRLASGECKIRLSQRLHQDPVAMPPAVASTSTTSSSLFSSSSPSVQQLDDAVMDHCGLFLAQGLEFVSQMADDATTLNRPLLSMAAIGHIRQSFQETLQTCAQYCDLVVTNEFGPRDETAIRLLGTLWTEFDIFDAAATDGSSTGDKEDDDGPSSHWAALHAVLTKTKNLDVLSSLFPALLAVLVGSDDDPARLRILKPYLRDFVSFFESWWSQAGPTHPSSKVLVGAGQVLELWYDCTVQSGVAVEVGGILRHLAQYLVRVLGTTRGPELQTLPAISVAVSSYVLLQGDEPPTEPDASILHRAISYSRSLTTTSTV